VSTPQELPRPSLRRRIEQALAAHPTGMAWRELTAELHQRALSMGERPPGPEQIVRQLGLLLVEGRVDERAGMWVLLASDAESRPDHWMPGQAA
jgi:hypothetical protein